MSCSGRDCHVVYKRAIKTRLKYVYFLGSNFIISNVSLIVFCHWEAIWSIKYQIIFNQAQKRQPFYSPLDCKYLLPCNIIRAIFFFFFDIEMTLLWDTGVMCFALRRFPFSNLKSVVKWNSLCVHQKKTKQLSISVQF